MQAQTLPRSSLSFRVTAALAGAEHTSQILCNHHTQKGSSLRQKTAGRMQELAALRAYVTAPGSNGQNQADSTVRLGVSHSNLKIQFLEIRLDKHVSPGTAAVQPWALWQARGTEHRARTDEH